MGLAPPATTVAVEPVRDLTDQLYSDERAAVADSVNKRRMEFSTGRYCARRALAGLGYPPGSIPVGPMRMPSWPAGVVASLSHSEGVCAAIAASAQNVHVLGLDVERIEQVDAAIVSHIARPDEIARSRTRVPRAWLSAGLFSIREAVFKAYYPITRVFLDFHDVDVDVDLGAPRTLPSEIT